jgi:class 3 adenylate cyclase/tetratricopeptide (TPR) repeat protein
MATCAQCGQENPDIAKFCLACGSPVAAAAPVATAEERKLITVLFTDIVGSTAKAEQMDPEDVRARLAPYYTRLRAELERFGGTVEKFIGDAVVALFGAPVAHEDDPERAVRAALAIRNAIDELNAEDEWLDLKIRIGVNTGEALVVVGAKASEGEGMASGDVMNTAARLQSAAPVDGILVGELTYNATREAITYRDAEPVAAKGKSEPVSVWEAVAVREDVPRAPALRTELVGRSAQVEQLMEAWDTVVHARRPGLVTVLGPPGVGKSRLIGEAAARAAEHGAVHWGRCLPYGEGITYWPVTELVKSAAGILQSDDRAVLGQRLEQFIHRLPTSDQDELRTIAAALSNLIGIPTTPRGTYTAAQLAQAELHWGIRRTLQLLAHDEPVMLVFEDLHWAEPTLLELIAYLMSADDEAALLLVGSARPELAETAGTFVEGNGRRRAIGLDTLTQAQSAELLAELLGDPELVDTPFGSTLIRNAGGNPLFLEETVRMLRERDLVDVERWRNEDVDLPAVPTTVQSLISSRLDQLGAGEKRVAHNAAVIGAVFWAGAVAHLEADDGAAPPVPADELDALARRDFVRRNDASSVAHEDEYAFKHILIRDVAYGQIPKGRRAQLHVRFADWVTILPGSADEFVEIFAWHLEQACQLSREVARSPIEPPIAAAAGALAEAARRAELRQSVREARRYYARALDVLHDTDAATAVELKLRRAIVTAQMGDLRDAVEELESVVGEAEANGRLDVHCEALVTLANIDQQQGRPSDARQRLAAANLLSQQLGDRRLQVRTGFSRASLAGDFDGEFEHAVGELREATRVAEETGDAQLSVEGHLRLGFLLYNMGALGAAEEELVRCSELAGRLGSRRDEARAAFQLGLVKYYLGDAGEAEHLNLQAREWLERTGESYFRIQNLRALGLYALARGDAVAAEGWLREAVPLALDEGGWSILELYRYLTEALVQQGRLEDAQDLVAFAARNVPDEDPYARAAVLVAEAICSSAAGDRTTMTLSFDMALRLLEDQNLPIELGETRIAFARALRASGEHGGARIELERARAVFRRIGARLLVDQIDAELEHVASGAGSAGPTSHG